jgi:ABC-type transport system involved in multi-copper enzyme maturation permease subunit
LTATFALIRDTFREAFARKIFWGLFGLSTLMILFFLFLLKIDVVEGAMATVSLIGRTVDRSIDADRWVRGVYAFIAGFLFTWGLFLSSFASAGLIPSVLEPGRIELLLSKPVSRTHILLGRYLGNVLVVTCNNAWLVLGVWTILGIKTGIWRTNFLLTIPVTMFAFAVLLTVVVFVGVVFESAALATMVSAALMLISAILAQTTTMLKLLSSEWSRNVWRTLYYSLPKIYDLGRMAVDTINKGTVDDYMPVWTSSIFAAVVLTVSLWIFHRRDF